MLRIQPCEAARNVNDSSATNLNEPGDPTRVSPSVRDRLVRLAYRFVWNRDDAEDVVQDALAVSHERRNELRDPSKWWAWTRKIVVQQSRLSGRKSSARRVQRERLAGQDLDRASEPPDAASGELKDIVRALLQELPQRQREVIVLRHLEELAYEEIAGLLEMSVSTARVHAKCGRQTLRELLVKRHPEWAVQWTGSRVSAAT